MLLIVILRNFYLTICDWCGLMAYIMNPWKTKKGAKKTPSRWFKVTFWFPSWRSLNLSKWSLNHPQKGTKNCQVVGIAQNQKLLRQLCQGVFDLYPTSPVPVIVWRVPRSRDFAGPKSNDHQMWWFYGVKDVESFTVLLETKSLHDISGKCAQMMANVQLGRWIDVLFQAFLSMSQLLRFPTKSRGYTLWESDTATENLLFFSLPDFTS